MDFKGFIRRKTLGLFIKTGGILSAPVYSGMGSIFMLHRVRPATDQQQLLSSRGLEITPEKLKWTIDFFSNRGYRFISLDELCQRLQTGKPRGKFIVFTLDDGYRDNYEFALPFFKRHNIPFAVYVTTSFPDNTSLLWWYHLEQFILENDRIPLNPDGQHDIMEISTIEEKEKAFATIRPNILKLDREERIAYIIKLCGITKEDIQKKVNQEALTWDMIVEMSKEPLVTIASHTVNHLPLAVLDKAVMEQEVISGRKRISDFIGGPVDHFAYPYGGLGEAKQREFSFINAQGIKSAVLNVPGNIFKISAKKMACLPRIGLSNEMTEQKLKNIVNGIHHFSFNGFHKTPV